MPPQNPVGRYRDYPAQTNRRFGGRLSFTLRIYKGFQISEQFSRWNLIKDVCIPIFDWISIFKMKSIYFKYIYYSKCFVSKTINV